MAAQGLAAALDSALNLEERGIYDEADLAAVLEGPHRLSTLSASLTSGDGREVRVKLAAAPVTTSAGTQVETTTAAVGTSVDIRFRSVSTATSTTTRAQGTAMPIIRLKATASQTAPAAATVEAAVEAGVQTQDFEAQCSILDPSIDEAAECYRGQHAAMLEAQRTQFAAVLEEQRAHFAAVLKEQNAKHEAERAERTDAWKSQVMWLHTLEDAITSGKLFTVRGKTYFAEPQCASQESTEWAWEADSAL